MSLPDYPHQVKCTHMESVDATRVHAWCTRHMGAHGVQWIALVDTHTFDFVFRFKQESDAVKFSLTWL